MRAGRGGSDALHSVPTNRQRNRDINAKHITLTKEEVRIRRDKEKKVPGTWTLCNDEEELGQ